MTAAIIIIFCLLLLIAYLFDLTSSRTRIPSVILLLLLGWVVRQFAQWSGIELPDLSHILPVLGTVGLILIVLEGALELEFNRSKLGLIKKSAAGALIPLLALGFLLAFLFSYFGHFPFRQSLLNVIPLCVISSSIAIPSARNLPAAQREFIVYESSLSDIFGVLCFNFLMVNEAIDLMSVGHFAFELVAITILSFAATLLLSFLLSKIEHHVKFVPIILLVVLIYCISKLYHLPGLIFILIFGLFLGNLDELKHLKWVKKMKPEALNREVIKFRELTGEATFLVRSMFFLLFGYLIETPDVLNISTLPWATIVVLAILVFRFLQLRLSGLPVFPMVFVAPRGLITILLFLSIQTSQTIAMVNKALIIQVILISALLMMTGLLLARNNSK